MSGKVPGSWVEVERRLSALEALVADKPGTINDGRLSAAGIYLNKDPGTGIKVDPDAPVYPWRDLIGNLVVDEAGVNSATLTDYHGGLVREYAFAAGDKIDLRFHMPHDYVPGTDLFIHMHWSHNGTAITGTGTTTGTIAHSYASGFGQGEFTAEGTVAISNTNVTTATVPQYNHRVEEVQLSQSGGGDGMLDTDILEVDGIVLCNFTMTTIPTITGGASAKVFVHAIDIHYQSTSVGTIGKAPNFYT